MAGGLPASLCTCMWLGKWKRGVGSGPDASGRGGSACREMSVWVVLSSHDLFSLEELGMDPAPTRTASYHDVGGGYAPTPLHPMTLVTSNAGRLTNSQPFRPKGKRGLQRGDFRPRTLWWQGPVSHSKRPLFLPTPKRKGKTEWQRGVKRQR